jgi:hypothetical protein
MPLPQAIRDELARKRAEEHERAEGDKRRALALAGLQCVAWSAIGIFSILWSAHTTSVTYGKVAFYGGIGLGNGGVMFTLLAAYRRGERRGDW